MTEQTDELDILAPDKQIVISGETLVVRELRFGEQIAHHAILSTLAEALRPAISGEEKMRSADELTLILDALTEHAEALTTMIAISVGKSREWVADLTGDEGEALTLVWWSVNQGFFIRRLLRPLVLQEARARLSAGDASSPSSSATDTLPAS